MILYGGECHPFLRGYRGMPVVLLPRVVNSDLRHSYAVLA
jgi:hypothetical protein